jgi:hypothetical protein
VVVPPLLLEVPQQQLLKLLRNLRKKKLTPLMVVWTCSVVETRAAIINKNIYLSIN